MSKTLIISYSPLLFENVARLRYHETDLPKDGYGAKHKFPPELFKVYQEGYSPPGWGSHVYVPKTNLIDGIKLLQKFLLDKFGIVAKNGE